MLDKIYDCSPHFIQNLFVSGYNILAYKKRYGGKYKAFRDLYKLNRSLSREDLLRSQKSRYKNFIEQAIANSEFYRKLYSDIENPQDLDNIQRLPIIDKELFRTNINDITIKSRKKLVSSKTGGTTGKSLEVHYKEVNLQERFALLDDFRSRFGYKLGKKTAWFSGKKILTIKDVNEKKFWKYDYFNKTKYYSTFHLKNNFLQYYVENLIKFKPKYLVGFPSTIAEIARYGLDNNYLFPDNTVKAVFPTAENLTKQMRELIEKFFHTAVYNQYASSEGAPFIFECKNGNLHLELQSGVFEVLDECNNPSTTGRLVVTSFTTEGTPLIRYDIGDSITLKNQNLICSCGNNNPIVKSINGRVADYVYSPENGKINIVNIANAIKDVKGIISYQIIQNEINCLNFNIIIDKSIYNNEEEKLFKKNWRDRVGDNMEFNINYVNSINVESSGKHRVVLNNIKDLIEKTV
ncbi:phenylacetate--CoA ligase family protein [Croceibacter atlanticus]|uniref:Possible CapK protein n=1 Tax=Croceibacter atlanticus (strain ATCC BAA-628 / JCM 21780 / CIP 108009 / IAM 15332 / KCTC 12090 / HTCC2559) TaxID=216432 RepID=A3UAX4_CROAH|nr:phenylacetate--CoA ligase family protein [Croceibacter atlanticus]EAP86960.1 possible CapK protein [Croceibacter atlanticus HTCC2559]